MERRPLMMLKDHLLNDFSSCSSNGFKSLPRRQCCTTVRFLLNNDLKTATRRKRSPARNSSRPSALQRASAAVINAVKLLPYPSSNSVKCPSASGRKSNHFLPRRISRKLFRKSFWRKAKKIDGSNVKRLRLFRDFVEEQHKPSDQTTVVKDYNYSTPTTTSTMTTKITPRISTSSSSNRNSNGYSNSNRYSDSWREGEIDFCTDAESSICGSGNGGVEGKKDLTNSSDEAKIKVSDRVGVSVGHEDSITYCAKQDHLTKDWQHEGKEQFSPVSVLDCPFKDEEEEDGKEDISSPFQRRLVRLEGTKKKLMQKIRRFESLAQLEPVDLEKRIALAESDSEWLGPPKQQFPMSIHDKNDEEHMSDESKHDRTEKKAGELLKLVRATNAPSNNSLTSKADSLLLDFFKEKIEENQASEKKLVKGQKGFDRELEVVKDWINGQPQEMFLGWEVKAKRHVYMADMEKNGNWRTLGEAKREVALEMELEIFSSLISDALLDIVV